MSLRRLWCLLFGHDWRGVEGHPYCIRCWHAPSLSDRAPPPPAH